MLENISKFYSRNSRLDVLLSALVVFGAALVAERAAMAAAALQVGAVPFAYLLGADALVSMAAGVIASSRGIARRRRTVRIIANLAVAAALAFLV